MKTKKLTLKEKKLVTDISNNLQLIKIKSDWIIDNINSLPDNFVPYLNSIYEIDENLLNLNVLIRKTNGLFSNLIPYIKRRI